MSAPVCKIYDFEAPFLFVQTPQDIDGVLAGFLDDRTLGITVQVCKTWQEKLKDPRDKAFVRFQEDRACIAQGYPKEMVAEFRKRQISIWQLPVLDLGNIYRDYIDFIEQASLTASIMRFQDCRSRVGLVFKIQGDPKNHSEIELVGSYFVKISEMSGYVGIFQRYTYQDSYWQCACQPQYLDSVIDGQSTDRVLTRTAPNVLKFATDLLDGQSPSFQLSGKIVQSETRSPEEADFQTSQPLLPAHQYTQHRQGEEPLGCIESSFIVIIDCFFLAFSVVWSALNRLLIWLF
jgi:hypothetical protein